MDNPNSSPPSRSPVGLWLLLLGGLIAGGVMALGIMLMGPGRSPGDQIRFPSPIPDPVSVGQPAPEFRSVTSEGEEVALSDYQGSLVAINFWATWCGPCRVEMPVLEAAYQEGRLVVLAVNAGESDAAVDSYVEELGLSFPAILDPDGEIIDQYAIRVFPTTIWVDEEGIVRAEHLGPLTEDLIEDYLEQLTS